MARGHKVILDSDLAKLYGVPAKTLNQAVRRNLERFPSDFMFQLGWEELDALRSQIVTLDGSRPERSGRGAHVKYRPYAFTEQGVAMLSSVLRSKRAVRVKVVFDAIRQLMAPPEPKLRRSIGFVSNN